jgi:transposase
MMFPDLKEYKIYIQPGKTDMRKAIKSLNEIIAYEMELDIYSKSIFIFCSKNRKTIKVVYWDKNGFCLWQKKLEKEKFYWPKIKAEVEKLSYDELQWLLSGFNYSIAHKEIKLSLIK